jgi:hypothetical protein
MAITKYLLGLFFLCFLVGPAWTKTVDPCSEGCADAVKILIENGSQTVASGSSCDGNYGQKGPATIADVLTRELSNFGRGTNVIEGGCTTAERTNCNLNIHHSYDDDVSSLEMKFDIVSERVVPQSLQCLLTP